MKNDVGLGAYDILKHSPKDFKTLEIQVILMEYPGNRTTDEKKGKIFFF